VDAAQDVRICDGKTVVKVQFEGTLIKDILPDDRPVSPYFPTHIARSSESQMRQLLEIERVVFTCRGC